jgi:hypothetical protein
MFEVDRDSMVSKHRDTSDLTDDVRPEHLDAAIQYLVDGSFEYLGLNGDVASVQTADTGAGFVFERMFNAEGDWVTYPGELDADQLRAALHAFLGGDLDAGLDWSATQAVAEHRPAKEKRGLFRRRG